MSQKNYYQRDKEVILNIAKEYYERNKGVLREKARNKYRELSDEQNNIKREYGRNRYKNMSEESKQRISKKLSLSLKNQHKKFLSFSLHNIKNETRVDLQ